MTRPTRLIGVCLTTALCAYPLQAQISLAPTDRMFWVAATTALAATAASDIALYRFSADQRNHTLDRWAEVGDGLGAGRHLIGTMAATWAVARLTGHKQLAHHVLHVAAAYTVGNVLVSALKPAVGRHRPDTEDDAWRFRPFTAHSDWHAFPSAHAIHAFTIASAVATETNSRWVSIGAYAAATLVGWSRVYRLEHWPSDALGAAILGIASAQTTLSWLHR
ncbi:MAG: phosphatase PAP2 family protein [Gemmatimonadaceae bacterium]